MQIQSFFKLIFLSFFYLTFYGNGDADDDVDGYGEAPQVHIAERPVPGLIRGLDQQFPAHREEFF